LGGRPEMIKNVDKKGIIAISANSFINELVVEAARISILNDEDIISIKNGQALLLIHLCDSFYLNCVYSSQCLNMCRINISCVNHTNL